MKVTNTTPLARSATRGRKKVAGAVASGFKLSVDLSDMDAASIVRARRAIRKATLKRDLGRTDQDLHDVDVVNGILMLIGTVLEDEGRDVRELDFDGRP